MSTKNTVSIGLATALSFLKDVLNILTVSFYIWY